MDKKANGRGKQAAQQYVQLMKLMEGLDTFIHPEQMDEENELHESVCS